VARYRGAACRLCRREGVKLHLKGERCLSAKCAMERKAYPPGMHGLSRRKKDTEYKLQLREKQKARRIYGLMEKQFRTTYDKASRKPGITGEVFIQMLEKRLDNVVFRLGFAPSRQAARQLVTHKHFFVNGKVVNLPSYSLKKGDKVEIAEKSRKLKAFETALENRASVKAVSWLSWVEGELKAEVIDEPMSEDINIPVEEHLIVEFYSK